MHILTKYIKFLPTISNQPILNLYIDILIMMLCLCLLTACQKSNSSTLNIIDTQTLGNEDFNAIHFINDTIGYVVGGDLFFLGKLLKTSNGGKSWDSLDIKTNKILYDIAFANDTLGFICGLNSKVVSNKNGQWKLYQLPTFPLWRTLYGIHFHNQFGMSCGGGGNGFGIIIRSSDYFNTFQQDTFDIELRSIFLTNDSTAYAAGFGTILKTTNFGESWHHLDVEGDFFIDLFFTDAANGYAIGQQGSIVKTTDAGKTWQYVRKANTLLQERKLFNAIYFKNENEGYIAGEKGTFWQSKDAGISWQAHQLEKNLSLKDVFAINEKVFLVGKNGAFLIIEDK